MSGTQIDPTEVPEDTHLYGQGTRRTMAWTFAAWTVVGAMVSVAMMPPTWGIVSTLTFGAILGFFSAMFPYTNRLLAMVD
jgi:hypothetical protein